MRLAAVLSVTALLVGCSDRTPPTVLKAELTPNDNETAPLAAKLRVETDEPTRLAIHFDDGEKKWSAHPGSGLSTTHDVPVLGLRPATRHTITAVLTDAAGNETTSEHFELNTPPLPEPFPIFEVRVREPERMEPGVTFFNLSWRPEPDDDASFGTLAAVDDTGEVVWFYRPDHGITDSRQLSNGNLLYNSSRKGLAYEVDMLGNVVNRWHTTGIPKEVPETSIPVETDTIHHEILEMPSGNLLALSAELRDYEDYPTSEDDPEAPRAPSTVVGDVLVEFSRDGKIVYEQKLLDVLDPYRVGYASLNGGYWEEAYEDVPHGDLRDWAHTNAVYYDATDDTFVLSPRRQDAVVKMTRAGEIRWILGTHDNWREPWTKKLLTPKGELEWPYHLHAPKVTPQSTILMFDNGTYRASPFTGQESMATKDCYSRAVEYAVDEETMEVRQVWSYGGPGDELYYSSYISDTDWMPTTGNVLVTDGGRRSDADWNTVDNDDDVYRWARIVEVTHTMPAEKVFELVIRGDPPAGWHVYRAERLPSLYGPDTSPFDIRQEPK